MARFTKPQDIEYQSTFTPEPLEFLQSQMEAKQKDFDAGVASSTSALNELGNIQEGYQTQGYADKIRDKYAGEVQSIYSDLIERGNVAPSLIANKLASVKQRYQSDPLFKNAKADADYKAKVDQMMGKEGFETSIGKYRNPDGSWKQLQEGSQWDPSRYGIIERDDHLAPVSREIDKLKADVASLKVGDSFINAKGVEERIQNEEQIKALTRDKIDRTINDMYPVWLQSKEAQFHINGSTEFSPDKYTKEQYLKEMQPLRNRAYEEQRISTSTDLNNGPKAGSQSSAGAYTAEFLNGAMNTKTPEIYNALSDDIANSANPTEVVQTLKNTKQRVQETKREFQEKNNVTFNDAWTNQYLTDGKNPQKTSVNAFIGEIDQVNEMINTSANALNSLEASGLAKTDPKAYAVAKQNLEAQHSSFMKEKEKMYTSNKHSQFFANAFRHKDGSLVQPDIAVDLYKEYSKNENKTLADAKYWEDAEKNIDAELSKKYPGLYKDGKPVVTESVKQGADQSGLKNKDAYMKQKGLTGTPEYLIPEEEKLKIKQAYSEGFNSYVERTNPAMSEKNRILKERYGEKKYTFPAMVWRDFSKEHGGTAEQNAVADHFNSITSLRAADAKFLVDGRLVDAQTKDGLGTDAKPGDWANGFGSTKSFNPVNMYIDADGDIMVLGELVDSTKEKDDPLATRSVVLKANDELGNKIPPMLRKVAVEKGDIMKEFIARGTSVKPLVKEIDGNKYRFTKIGDSYTIQDMSNPQDMHTDSSIEKLLFMAHQKSESGK